MEDLTPINSIYERHYSEDFGIPSLAHTIGNGVVCSDKLVAFGMVKLYPEAIIIIDKEASLKDRVIALEILHDEAVKVCKMAGYDELRANTTNFGWERLLNRHFDFLPYPGRMVWKKIEE